MAIANSDGSIILSTKVDTSGINKGMSQMQGKATSLTKTFSKLGAAIASAFAIQKIIQFSNEAGQLATQTEASVQRLVDIYGSASDSVGYFIDQNARALGMSKAAAASFSSVYGNLFSVWADQATNAELTNRYLNMTAVVASKTGRTVEDVQERVRSGLLGNTEAIEDLGVFVNVKTIEMTDAFQRMANGKSWEQLDAYTQQQIRSMAILEQATAKYGDQVAETSATTRNRYKAAYEDFKNSWGNIVNTVLLPVLQTLTQIFDIATRGLNALSGRSGQILENAQLQEEKADNTAENIKDQTKNQKELNKEMKKTLASFDDVQILSSKNAENTSVGNENFGEFGLGDISPDGSHFEEEINSTLLSIMGVVSVSLVALGCILLFTGNIGWGLGFLIAGASTVGVTMANLGDDTISQKTKDALTNAVIIAGIVAITIGILLCVASKWALGISLMVVGASSIVAPVALNWDGVKEKLQSSFGAWLAIGGLVAIVLGVLLCVAQIWAIGIGLIAMGAAAFVTPIVVNWDSIYDGVKSTFSSIIDWIKSYGLLALGIILCATGVGVPIGLLLISREAEKMGASPIINWNYFVSKIRSVGEAIKKIFVGVWTYLKIGFKSMVNSIISVLNMLIDGMNTLTTPVRAIGYGAARLFGSDISWSDFDVPHIPKLAKGAVLPANQPFIALLGDQKKGTNVEAPAELIKQMAKEAITETNIGSQVVKEEHYYMNETELMSIVYRLVKGGERLRGSSLISGGGY